jgi:hypothetical protein
LIKLAGRLLDRASDTLETAGGDYIVAGTVIGAIESGYDWVKQRFLSASAEVPDSEKRSAPSGADNISRTAAGNRPAAQHTVAAARV